MTNISSTVATSTAASIISRNNEDQAKSLEKIASGTRIPQASDDAAGLAVGTALLSDVAVFKQAAGNIQGTSAALTVADGALNSVGGLLERQAVLAAQAQAPGLDNAARQALDSEFQAINAEIDAIQGNTSFGGQNLVDGSFNQDVAVGPESGDTLAADLSGIDVSTANLGTAGSDLLSAAGAAAALDAVNTASETVAGFRADVGSTQSAFSARAEVVAQSIVSTQESASSILDTDLAEELARLSEQKALSDAAIAAQSQSSRLDQSLVSLLR